jgi:hypothetical protein
MGDRYWMWVGVRLLVAVVLVAWVFSYLGAGSGEKEFQKTLDAMKQVHSFRAAYSATPPTQHNELLWEVDCDHDVLHAQFDYVQTNRNPPGEMKTDQLIVAGRAFDHQSDGSWAPARYGSRGGSAKWYCDTLAKGTDVAPFPQIATMIKRAIIQKGDKKTVNGVRCREWLVTMKGAPGGLAHDTVCIGLDDNLPYEMTVDWEHSRTSFSDYNVPLKLDLPEGALQPASAPGSN